MRSRPRPFVRLVALIAFSSSSVAGCYNTMAVAPPSPSNPGQMMEEVDRVVLNGGEIIRLSPGEFELGEGELSIRGPSEADARTVARSDIARFEIRDLDKSRTVIAALSAYVGFMVFALGSGLLDAR